MADISQVLTLSWARNGESIAQTVTIEADGEGNRNVTVNAATTDKRVDIAIDVSELKLLYIHSDQDITIETNSGSAADDTLTIKANKPFVWYADCGLTNPLGTDVTALFITNAGATAANVKIRTLEDTTP